MLSDLAPLTFAPSPSPRNCYQRYHQNDLFDYVDLGVIMFIFYKRLEMTKKKKRTTA
jgi:CCR4-NOT transcriptional regulation complex NOT5 subunit